MQELVRQVQAWARRSKLQSSVKWVFFGLAFGLGVALLIALSARVWPIFKIPQLLAISALFALMGMAISWFGPWFGNMRRSALSWARRFDQEFKLHQRISTAMEAELGVLPVKNPDIRKLQMHDALRSAASINIGQWLPLRIVWRDVVFASILLTALLFAVFLPNAQLNVLARREEVEAQKQAQVQVLEEIKQQIANSELIDDNAKTQALEALKEAQQALSNQSTSPEDSLAALNNAQQKLDALGQQISGDKNDSLQQIGQSMSPNTLTNELSNALASRDFQEAANEMRNLTDNDGKGLNEQQQNSMIQQLEQMAQNSSGANPELAQNLNNAAQQLRQGNTQQAQQQLNQAAEKMDKAAKQEQAAGQLERAESGLNEARQKLGKSAGKQSPQQAQGRQPGQGQGVQGEGQDAQGEGQDAQGGGQGQGQDSRSSAHREDTGTSNQVWAPSRIMGGSDLSIDSTGKPVPDPKGKPNTTSAGQSTVPYQQVYADYKKTADDALQNGDVPAELRDYVRDYFTQLNPGRNK